MNTLVVASLALLAAGWDTSLPADRVGAWIGPGHACLVAAAGKPDARPAAASLVAALRASGRVSLVMTAEAIGDASTLDDAEVVRRAARFPVDRIAVVRIFVTGGVERIVATLYDKNGSAVSAVTTERGTPIAEPSPSSPGAGASAAAQRAAASVIAGPDGPDDPNYLWIGGAYQTSFQGQPVLVRASLPHQGVNGKAIAWARFYELAGRPDLARSARIRTRAWWTCAAVAVAGGVTAFALLVAGHSFDAPVFVALGATGVGGIGTKLIRFNPVPMDESQRIADDANRRRKSADTGRAQVAFGAGPGGIGLALEVRF